MSLPLFAAVFLLPPLASSAAIDRPDFATEVRPILARRCFACHGNDEETREAELRLDSFAAATLNRDGFPAVVPGIPEDSEVMARITDEFDPMPPAAAGERLTADEVDLLRGWIRGGAEYAPHWAFVAPERPESPGARDVHPIDALVAEQHSTHGLNWSPQADDYTLLRRLTLDLTGLPPTPEAARAFASSPDPHKYELAVDELLDSPAYAERWAAVWLDLARYADSSGHGSDPLREIWRYRDWVIEAFDQNMPFDEFTEKQLAGDLLPDADRDARLATAFHRNTMTNTEGGTDDEEFRVLAIKDRVNTTMSVWMGLTAGCAECHSHKYDPISHVEYYQLFDIFNQTEDSDKNDDRPRLETPTPGQQVAWELARREVSEAEARLNAWHDGGNSAARLAGEREFLDGLEGQPWTSVQPHVALRVRQTASWTSDENLVPRTLRLDVLRGPALPNGGPGLASQDGDLALSGLALRATRVDAAPLLAATVRIELPGDARILSLAEVELLGPEGAPIVGALWGARQSTTGFGGDAARAIDGRTDGVYDRGSVTHTVATRSPWWEADLVAPLLISGVRVWPRTDGTLESRTRGFQVVFLDGDGTEVWRSAPAPAPAGDGVVGSGETLLPRPDPFLDVGPVVGEPLLAGILGAAFEQGSLQAAFFDLPKLSNGAYRWSAALPRELGDRLDGRWRLATTGVEQAPQVSRSSELTAKRDAARARLAALHVPTTPIMVELPASAHRTTHVLTRGNFLQPEEEVTAAVPAVFPQLPDGVEPDRLALGRWLMSDTNPLPARVTVNRIWSRLFGRGLVLSEGDFGSQAELPTHPRLLDWLAVEFRTNGWDQKALLRTIVTSRTYRQSSDLRGTDVEADPAGVWLSRYPRQRLEAEMVRDTVLAISGLLSHKRFGPSVFPPQPDGLWQAAFNGERDWKESQGEDRYRRGLYVFLRRTVPYPMLEAFDAPSRETCTVQRISTNTPLQAFVTLNDPVFVEAGRALARRSLEAARASGDRGDREMAGVIEHMLWFCLGRPPAAEQAAILASLYADSLNAFRADRRAAREFGDVSVGDDLAPAERAAWTLVASAALNLDRVLTKE